MIFWPVLTLINGMTHVQIMPNELVCNRQVIAALNSPDVVSARCERGEEPPTTQEI